MTLRQYVCFVLIGLLTTPFFAQTGQTFDYNSSIREMYNHNWSIGAGVNIVDDSGKTVGGITDPGDYWHFSMPFYVSAEFYLNNQFGFMAMLSTNKYKEGKILDNGTMMEGEEANYFAADLSAKYYFRDLIKTYTFDPYVFAGFGFTSIDEYKTEFEQYGETTIREVPSTKHMTFNFGLGANYWFSDTWGINGNLAGKVSLDNSDWKSNQKQYSLGAIYVLK